MFRRIDSDFIPILKYVLRATARWNQRFMVEEHKFPTIQKDFVFFKKYCGASDTVSSRVSLLAELLRRHPL
jgi:hypothetical protein